MRHATGHFSLCCGAGVRIRARTHAHVCAHVWGRVCVWALVLSARGMVLWKGRGERGHGGVCFWKRRVAKCASECVEACWRRGGRGRERHRIARARERESERARERESARARERESTRAREQESKRAQEHERKRGREEESKHTGEHERTRAREHKNTLGRAQTPTWANAEELQHELALRPRIRAAAQTRPKRGLNAA